MRRRPNHREPSTQPRTEPKQPQNRRKPLNNHHTTTVLNKQHHPHHQRTPLPPPSPPTDPPQFTLNNPPNTTVHHHRHQQIHHNHQIFNTTTSTGINHHHKPPHPRPKQPNYRHENRTTIAGKTTTQNPPTSSHPFSPSRLSRFVPFSLFELLSHHCFGISLSPPSVSLSFSPSPDSPSPPKFPLSQFVAKPVLSLSSHLPPSPSLSFSLDLPLSLVFFGRSGADGEENEFRVDF